MEGKNITRRSDAEWRGLVQKQELSGLSQAMFCAQENIAESSFAYWKKKARPESQNKFIQVLPDKVPERKREEKEIELSLPWGIVLKVRG